MAQKRIKKVDFDRDYFNWRDDKTNTIRQEVYANNLYEISEQVLIDMRIWDFKKAKFLPELVCKAVYAGDKCRPEANNSSPFSYIYAALFKTVLSLNKVHIEELKHSSITSVDDELERYLESKANNGIDLSEYIEATKLNCAIDSYIALKENYRTDMFDSTFIQCCKNMAACGLSREESDLIVSNFNVSDSPLFEKMPHLSSNFMYKLEVLSDLINKLEATNFTTMTTTANVLARYNSLIRKGYIKIRKIETLHRNLSKYAESRGFTLIQRKYNDSYLLYLEFNMENLNV